MTKKRYNGMAWRTDFNNMRRPGQFRDLKVQEESFDSSLTRRCFQEAFFRADSMRGAPRNLARRELLENPRILVI